MGRPSGMVRYLVMKAKHRYALEQHEALIEELRVARWELKRERESKEGLLDEVLRANFGRVRVPLFSFPIFTSLLRERRVQADSLISPISGVQKFEGQYRLPLASGEVEYEGGVEMGSFQAPVGR